MNFISKLTNNFFSRTDDHSDFFMDQSQHSYPGSDVSSLRDNHCTTIKIRDARNRKSNRRTRTTMKSVASSLDDSAEVFVRPEAAVFLQSHDNIDSNQTQKSSPVHPIYIGQSGPTATIPNKQNSSRISTSSTKNIIPSTSLDNTTRLNPTRTKPILPNNKSFPMCTESSKCQLQALNENLPLIYTEHGRRSKSMRAPKINVSGSDIAEPVGRKTVAMADSIRERNRRHRSASPMADSIIGRVEGMDASHYQLDRDRDKDRDKTQTERITRASADFLDPNDYRDSLPHSRTSKTSAISKNSLKSLQISLGLRISGSRSTLTRSSKGDKEIGHLDNETMEVHTKSPERSGNISRSGSQSNSAMTPISRFTQKAIEPKYRKSFRKYAKAIKHSASTTLDEFKVTPIGSYSAGPGQYGSRSGSRSGILPDKPNQITHRRRQRSGGLPKFDRSRESSVNNDSLASDTNPTTSSMNNNNNHKRNGNGSTNNNSKHGQHGSKCPKYNNAAGISLQIQQWKTVAEFESDEQLKFLVFSELKNISTILLFLSMMSIVVSIGDIQLTNEARKSDVQYAFKFLTPQCWPESKVLTIEDMQDFAVDLFNVSHDKQAEYLLRHNIKYGDHVKILHEAIKPWQHRRHKYVFEPIEPWRSYVLSLRASVSILTIIMLIYLYKYYAQLTKLYCAKKQLPEGAKLFQVQLFKNYLRVCCIFLLHVPPIPCDWFFNITEHPFQWITSFRLAPVMINYLREHHPMRYNRMTEILCTLSSVRLNTSFLIKAPFLRTPLKVLLGAYGFILLYGSYTVYILEQHSLGKCNSYLNSLWLVMVTTTNLGFGDYLAGNYLSKISLSLCSITGIILMALLVNYVSDVMVIPPDEKRIIGFYEKHRMMRLQRIAAANLIKSRYRLYKMKCKVSECFNNRMSFENQVYEKRSHYDYENIRRKKAINFEKRFKGGVRGH